jgi:tetratricopeptide (TPR) repeat protein
MLRHAITICLLASLSWAQQSTPPQSAPPAGSPADLVKQGEKLSAAGKQDEAIALYRKALQQSPALYEAHLETGIALDLKGEYAEAQKHLAKAIDVAMPDSKPQALRAMAISHVFEGDSFKASEFDMQVFNSRLGKSDSTGAGEIANELARIYLETGDPDHAYKWYRMGFDTAGHQADMTDADKNLWLFRWENAQARIAVRRGKGDEAQQHVAAAKAALDKANNPDQLRFYPYLTGYVAFYLGDYKTAVADLQKADQRDPLVLVLLAQAFEKSGDQTNATDYYQKVLASNGHNASNALARPLAKKKRADSGKKM